MKYTKILFAALLGFGLIACDLDRQPLDPNTDTTFNKDAVFAKCYATFGLTGQVGPDGSGDLDGIDEGTSSFYRLFWELNEFCTDEGWWIWNDVGLADIRTMTWSANNDLVFGLYSRFYFDITLCNSFLDNTADMKDDATQAQRAEVRMIRAINYYYLLDMFHDMPFSLTVSPNKPMPTDRPTLFDWLVKECKDLENDPYIVRAGKRTNKYRVDQACAWFLLMRLYLNSTVYNESSLGMRDGANHLSEAKNYAEKLILQSGYKLHGYTEGGTIGSGSATDLAYERTSDHVYYSAYQQLFMGDNDKNGAQDEAILLIYQDAVNTRSWGGARFVVNAVRDANFVPCGSSDTWSCFRTSPEFVYYWVDANKASSISKNEYQMPVVLKDDRAIMASVTTAGKKMKLTGQEAADFYASWAVVKFNGLYASDKKAPADWTSPVGEAQWPDTDIPLFRLAEAYLTYAEATLESNNAEALKAVNALRARANAAKLTSLNKDALLKEWTKEFYCEGRRRTDLIRFGQFAGPSSTMTWEGHKAGKDKKYLVYPIPANDVTANENLKGLNEAIGY